MTSHQSAIVGIALSCTIFELTDAEKQVETDPSFARRPRKGFPRYL